LSPSIATSIPSGEAFLNCPKIARHVAPGINDYQKGLEVCASELLTTVTSC